MRRPIRSVSHTLLSYAGPRAGTFPARIQTSAQLRQKVSWILLNMQVPTPCPRIGHALAECVVASDHPAVDRHFVGTDSLTLPTVVVGCRPQPSAPRL